MCMDHAIDKHYLREHNYKDDKALKIRKALYHFTFPKIDIKKELMKHLHKGQSILDVGCGNGDFLIFLRKEQFSGKLVGIDISLGIMESGIEQNEKERLNITFKVGDAQQLEFPDEHFDVVLTKHMLYHVPDIQKAVDEVFRCLKKGGTFLATLNSTKTRPKMWAFRLDAAKKLGCKIQQINKRANIENMRPFLSRFSKVDFYPLRNVIKLKEPDPYLNWFITTKDYFDPQPDKRAWDAVVEDVRKVIEKEIQQKGVFTDDNMFGLFVCKK